MNKKIITAWNNLPKESKRFFWGRILKLNYEVSSAIRNNDIPTLKQLTLFLLGTDGLEEIKHNLLREVVEELK